MCTHGAGGWLRPLDPRTERTAALRRLRAAVAAAVAGPRARHEERRAVPGVPGAHGRPRPSRRCRASSACPSALQADCRGRPCGNALAGQPEGWPSLTTDKRKGCAAPSSRSTAPETASAATDPMPNKPPSSSAPATADGTRRQEQRRRSSGIRDTGGETGKRQSRDPACRRSGPGPRTRP